MKKLLAILLTAIMLFSVLPMTAIPSYASEVDSAATGAETFTVSTAQELRTALQFEGNAVITVMKDIEYTLPDNFEWQYGTDECFVKLGSGDKTLELNGHRVYITDNFVTTAKYITEKRYNVETGATEEVFTLLSNSFVDRADMIHIGRSASLTVNGYKSGSSMMMDAQMPSYDQMMDKRIVMYRQVFNVSGGELTINGGEYQGGRRKTSYVTYATKVKNSWFHDLDYFDSSYYHYTGNAEYCILGAAVFAMYQARVTVNGGTMIGHGCYGYNYRKAAIQAFHSGTVVTVNDAVLKGYTGANAFAFGDGVIGNIMAGEAVTEAPDRMLWPDGKWHQDSDWSYAGETNYDAIDVGRGNTVFEPELNTTVTTSGNKTYYYPLSRSVDALKWHDGSAAEKTYYLGAQQAAYFDMPFTYFPNEDIPGVTHSYEYQWGLSKRNSSGNYTAVDMGGSGWVGSGHSRVFDIKAISQYLEPGGTYRLTARLNEDWSSTHAYNYKVTAHNALVFSVKSYVVDSLDIYVNAPTAGKELSFDASKVWGLPDYVSCQEIIWYDSKNSIKREGTVAVAGESYEVWVKLSTSVGAFANRSTLSANSKLNNNTAGITTSGDEVYVRYRFPACAKVISSVELTLTRPAPGSSPSYSVYTGDSSYGVWDAEDSVQWMVSSDGKSYSSMAPADRFAVGKYYKLYVDIKAGAGYTFAVTSDWDTNVSAAVNDKRANVYKAYEQDPEKIITVSYDYGELRDPAFVISSIEITDVTAPAAGASPVFTAEVPYGKGYEIYALSDESDNEYSFGGVEWFLDTDEQARMTPEDKFEAGQDYTCILVLICSSEQYVFDDGVTATINGEAAECYSFDSIAIAGYTFTCPEAGCLLGDVDGNGVVNNRDAMILDRYIAGWDGYEARITNMNAADLNRDTKVNNRDAVILDRYIAGWDGYDKYIITI